MESEWVRVRIGVSACLLGEPVRFNAGHKGSELCLRTLAPYFEYVSLCPEMAIGLPAPRQAIRLLGSADIPRAAICKTKPQDLTELLRLNGEQTAFAQRDLCGYILMQKSPSCAVHKIKVYRAEGEAVYADSRGIFAEALLKACPNLPVEEEGRLHDPVLLENFITRVFAYAHWQEVQQQGLSRAGLYRFHARYKYQLLANSRVHYQTLGRLLAQGAHEPLEKIAADYFSGFMQALRQPASRGSHCNVLQHLAGHLKRYLGTADKRELHQLIIDYRNAQVPLVVPVTLLKHHFRHHPDPYIAQQAYLQPYPEALGLRDRL